MFQMPTDNLTIEKAEFIIGDKKYVRSDGPVKYSNNYSILNCNYHEIQGYLDGLNKTVLNAQFRFSTTVDERAILKHLEINSIPPESSQCYRFLFDINPTYRNSARKYFSLDAKLKVPKSKKNWQEGYPDKKDKNGKKYWIREFYIAGEFVDEVHIPQCGVITEWNEVLGIPAETTIQDHPDSPIHFEFRPYSEEVEFGFFATHHKSSAKWCLKLCASSYADHRGFNHYYRLVQGQLPKIESIDMIPKQEIKEPVVEKNEDELKSDARKLIDGWLS